MDLLVSAFLNSRIALADLDSGQVEVMPMREDMAAQGMGGIGAASLLHGLYRASDPLVLGTGPLTGSFAPASCLLTATFSPGTASLIHVPFLEHTGPGMKFAGIDYLVVIGRAPQPISLDLLDGTVRITPAGDIEGTLSQRESAIRSRRGPCPDSILLTGSAADSGSNGAVLSCGLWGSMDKTSLGSYAAAKNIRAVTFKATRGVAFPRDGLERGATLMKTLHRDGKSRRTAVPKLMEGSEAAARLIGRHFRKSHACRHCPLACVSYLEFRPAGLGLRKFRAPAQGLFVMDHEGFGALAAVRPQDAHELMRHCIELGYDPIRAAQELESELSTEDAIERITGLCTQDPPETGPGFREAQDAARVPRQLHGLFGGGIPRILPSGADDGFDTWQRRVSLAMILGVCPVMMLYYHQLRADDLLAFISADAGVLADLKSGVLDLCDSLTARPSGQAGASSGRG